MKKDPGAIRIPLEIYDWMQDEQHRVRKATGKKPTYSDLVEVMFRSHMEALDLAPPAHNFSTKHLQRDAEIPFDDSVNCDNLHPKWAELSGDLGIILASNHERIIDAIGKNLKIFAEMAQLLANGGVHADRDAAHVTGATKRAAEFVAEAQGADQRLEAKLAEFRDESGKSKKRSEVG